MESLGIGHRALWICSVAVVLVACGGLQSPIGAPGGMPPSVTNSEQDAHSGPLLYVSNDGDYNEIKIYHAGAKDPSPIEVISSDLDTPFGDCLDSQGTLYVANEPAGAGWVSEYPAGKAKASKVITKGINTPAFCAIDSKGNLWVTNIGFEDVVEYEKGSTRPHATIKNGLTYPDGIAIDQAGNIYIGNPLPSRSPTIQVFSPGSKSPSRTITDGVTSPVGITVDANGTLYVANSEENNVEEYRYGQSHPYQTITDGMDRPLGVAVNKGGYLYVTNLGNLEIVEFAPGSLTPSNREISKGLWQPSGTAYSPPLLP
jgi:hypothetical protein